MALQNLNSRHLLPAEKDSIKDLLLNLEAKLASALVNLTATERQQYGSVNEQNKLVINKVKDFRDNQPDLSSPDIDWAEFENDYQSREFLQNINQRLQVLIEGLQSAKILHDWDNYQAALTDYGYTQYKRGSGAPGYDTKLNEIKQFFSRKTSVKPNNTDN